MLFRSWYTQHVGHCDNAIIIITLEPRSLGMAHHGHVKNALIICFTVTVPATVVRDSSEKATALSYDSLSPSVPQRAQSTLTRHVGNSNGTTWTLPPST